MNGSKARPCIASFALVLSALTVGGCGYDVPPEHYDVILDVAGARDEGFVDFPGYSSDGSCVEDERRTCTPGALSVGTVHDLPNVTSARIQRDAESDARRYVFEIDGAGHERFECRLEPRDIGHAFQCTGAAGDAGAIASITLTPVP